MSGKDNGLITFSEGRRHVFRHGNQQLYYYPVYMQKCAQRFFVSYRKAHQTQHEKRKLAAMKQQLIANDGRFVTIYGYYMDPWDTVLEIAKRQCVFAYPVRLFHETYNFTDFHDNDRIEGISSFRYRLYDHTMIVDLKRSASHLIYGNWSDNKHGL